MNSIYLRHFDLLEKFIAFYDECLSNDSILLDAFKHMIKPKPDKAISAFELIQTQNIDDATKNQFLQSIKHDNVIGNIPHLSQRELECLSLLAHGKTAKGIAAELDLKAKTVYNYLDNVKQKLCLQSKGELAEYYWQNFS